MIDADALSCQELVELVTDYLEGRSTPAIGARSTSTSPTAATAAVPRAAPADDSRRPARLRLDDLSPEAEEALLQAFRGWLEAKKRPYTTLKAARYVGRTIAPDDPEQGGIPRAESSRLALHRARCLLAVSPQRSRAATQMPIGFYDDPSFRWSTDRAAESRRGAAAGARSSTRPPNWARSRRRSPRTPTNPTIPPTTSTTSTSWSATPAARHPRDDRHQGHAEVGERRQDAEPAADEARRPDEVRADARDRYTGRHRATATSAAARSGTSRTCGIFLTPQFSGKKIVSPANYAKLYKAAYAGIKAGEHDARRSRSARRRPRAATSR